MTRNYKTETEKRVEFIRGVLEKSGAGGIVFGNSGGKDSALVGILCKKACHNTLGLILPCGSKRNFGEDLDDAKTISELYGIEARVVDLSKVADVLKQELEPISGLSGFAIANIAPRLRMTALYSVAASEGRLVAGTGNKSERYMGYFTKWGDGAYDFNPIADLTVTEIYEFLEYLGAPRRIIEKQPSGGLFDGQTDEAEMGITYKRIDDYLLNGSAAPDDLDIITRYHRNSEHKRNPPATYDPTG